MALEEFKHFFKESFVDDKDDTSGTSDFDNEERAEPDDCYCESFDLERLSPDIQLRPADEHYLDNIIEWKIQTILEGYPDEQPSPEEYNKISNYVKNETPGMLNDTRIIMYDNDQSIGMIIAYQKEQDWFIDDIFLIPEFRHKGIGRMILENEIASHDQLALWVYKSNKHAISLYESLGFKVEESIKERQMMRLRKTDVELIKGWRVTYKGIGIYEALKNAMFEQTGSSIAWMTFINSDACNWLPKPPSYGNNNKSFFTEKGFNRFTELVLPIIAQYIDQTKIYIEEIMVPTNQIVYSDEFQFVTSDTIQESAIPRSNEVYTNGGSIEKVNDFPFDKVYFGSPHKIGDTLKLDGPLFITPYPGIASIFAVRPQNLRKYGVQRGQRVNRDYEEWDTSKKDSLLQQPLKELHMIIQGASDIKPSEEMLSGYIYTIDVTPEIRDHIYQSQRMNKTLEFCIDKLESVSFSNTEQIYVKLYVRGGEFHQEAFDAVTGKEIPIDHAYTMDEMKERTYTDDDLDKIQSKEELDAFYTELKSKLGQDETIQEAKLPSKKRNKLPDSDFALVYTDANGKKIRKYPIHDEAHCKAAAHMFPRGVPLKYKAEVARKILRRAHKFGIDTSGWKNLNKFKESD